MQARLLLSQLIFSLLKKPMIWGVDMGEDCIRDEEEEEMEEEERDGEGIQGVGTSTTRR
jgi:hypothetical protein